METTTNISLGFFIGTQIVMYLIGLLEMVRSVNKYHYSILWIILSLLFFVWPPFFAIYINLLEKSKVKKDKGTESMQYLTARVRLNIAVALFIFYYLLIPLFTFFLKYASTNSDWYEEIALVCVNIALIALYPVLVYSRKRLNLILTKMTE